MSGAVVSALLLGLLIAGAPVHSTVIVIHDMVPAAYHLFGGAIDSADNYLAIGVPTYNGQEGQVLVYDAASGSLLRTISNPSGQGRSNFGASVEISGNLLAVGEPGVPGRVYIFNLANGTLLDTLVSPNPDPSGAFGATVDVADGLLAVGAPYDTVNGLPEGRVYIFGLQTGTEKMTLVSPNLDVEQHVLGGGFGTAISILDGRVIVGAPGENQITGRAYVFDALTGALISTFVSPNYPNEVFFGSSVALSDHLAFVGSRGETVNGFEAAGGVFVFNINTGALKRTIVDPNPQTSGSFGMSLALNGQNLIVGAPFDFASAFTYGRVYVFGADSGSLKSSLVSPDAGVAGSGGCFGHPVDSADSRIYVSALCQVVNGQLWAGAVYIFSGTLT